ncbi:hypothetical protein [Nocardia iowensis]|uniref:Uncharacterized protein n=1 Tax=Nocardia iowensis TaxID=204891 RepID=A0ABX8RMU5_NOCIO|nr:hypothetical protein [Nocardia iowensis]QXN90312.1 hypothetical protein KV110_33620 [Nocardia iowensis]
MSTADPFGDGQDWLVIDEINDELRHLTRVLWECRYIVESGGGRAAVTERRWDDGQHESREVEPLT